jgi:uncharacterized protein (DUF488 family)
MYGVMTIGYEGAALQAFIDTLLAAKVNLLLDVRELPISRRKGFSKSALSEALRAAGIEYRHEKKLGSPTPIRKKLHADGNYAAFFESFTEYLATQDELIGRLKTELSGNVALMCYERDPSTCHRSVVAKALTVVADQRPVHLGVRQDVATEKRSVASSHSRQSVSAT